MPVVASAFCCKCTQTSDPAKNVCLTATEGACSTMIEQSTNSAVKSFTCDGTTLTDEQCKPIYDGGSALCSGSPVEASSYAVAGPGSVPTKDAIRPPVLNVPIPGLTFQNVVAVDGGVATIPFLAQYVAAAYRYLLGIVVVAAATAIVYGGFRYILGSTAGSISAGKEIIQDAIIGLLLVFGSHIILITLNPALVDLKGLKVATISQKAFDKAEAERERVAESATRPLASSREVEVPVIIESATGALSVPYVSPVPSSTAPGLPAKPGEVVKDANGIYVAQGNCPAGMVAIRQSDEYAKKMRKTVASFCMDVYEAPNQLGVKPLSGVTDREADWYCNERGKRLCADSEWTRACLGPTGVNTYGYGPDFVAGKLWLQYHPGHKALSKSDAATPPCNYGAQPPPVSALLANDSKYHQVDFWISKDPKTSLFAEGGSSLLQDPKKKDTVQYVLDKTKAANEPVVPSGSMPTCVTAEGVFDLSGNTQEIMLKDSFVNQTTEQRVNLGTGPGPYTWGNFYFSPIAHLANTDATPTCTQRWGGHAVVWRGFENGFRCCIPLNDNP